MKRKEEERKGEDDSMKWAAKSPPGSGPVNFGPRSELYCSCIMRKVAVPRTRESTNEEKTIPFQTQPESKAKITGCSTEEDYGRGKTRPEKGDLGWEDLTAEDIIWRYNWERIFVANSKWHSKVPNDGTENHWRIL